MGGFTKLQHGHLSHTGTWIERLREAAFILHAAVPSPQQIWTSKKAKLSSKLSGTEKQIWMWGRTQTGNH